ncbi:MAG: multi-sensor hybrid histidine kinase [Candidatus Solibacter sp.]|nr:multi-sensor hybrid histidine kinase [Candidatus Solibacter sp.]
MYEPPSGPGKALRASARAPYLLFGLLAMLTAAIGLTGWTFHVRQKAAFESEVNSRLLAIADSKVRKISEWRRERMGEARTLMEDPLAQSAFARVIDGRASAEERARAAGFLASICRNMNYAGAVLVDPAGHVPMYQGRLLGDSKHFRGLIETLMRTGDIVERDLHMEEAAPEAYFGVNVPLRSGPGAPIFGGVMLSIDPREYIGALRMWPVPSRTGEVILVRREKDSVLYLTELRDRPGSAMRYRVPMSRRDLASVMAVAGARGNLQAMSEGGSPVFAAVRRVPESDWYLIAQMNSEEAWEPFQRDNTMFGVAAASLALALGALLFVLWRRHQVAAYLQLYESERAHEALSEQYDYLSRFANDVILLLGPDGAILRANDRAADTYGYPIEELGRKNLCELRAPSARPDFEADWRLAGERNSLIFETLHRARDGREFPIEMRVRTLEVEKKIYRQAIIRDISERKLSELELSRSEARLRQVVENAPYGILVVDGLEILYANPTALGLLGAAREQELIGRSLLQFTAPEERDEVSRRARLHRQGKEAPYAERRYVRLDGREGCATVTATAIEYNERPATLVFFQDVTEHKRAAEQRLLLEEQLRQSQKMDSVGRLAGGVAHDFNNYLTVINGYCDMLLPEAPPESELEDGLREIRSAGERAASLTGQLLMFSRKQLGTPRAVCLNQMLQDSGKMLRRLIGEQVEIVTRGADDLPQIMADPGQMDQVLMNLTINARDAMPSGGRIEIGTRKAVLDELAAAGRDPQAKAGTYVVLSVSDTGIGMTPDVLAKIFEPFFTTKGVGHGTGLGLCTTYGIVQQSGGWIEIDSEPGHGSTFHVWFPATAGPAVMLHTRVRNSGKAAERDAMLLLVEDQADVRRLASSILKLQGYRLLEAEDAGHALAISNNYPGTIDLLVTDVIMPGMNGRELADQLLNKRSGLKVLYMSGYSGDAIARQGCLESGTEYLPKPFSPDELSSKVRDVLRISSAGRTILVIDDDAKVRGLLQLVLSGAGYRVLVAADGKAGMEALESQAVDLVITDLVMPEQEGLETVTLLHAQRPKLPVIAISGAFGGSFLKAAGLLGASATLAKPIAPDELLRTVERFMTEEVPAGILPA